MPSLRGRFLRGRQPNTFPWGKGDLRQRRWWMRAVSSLIPSCQRKVCCFPHPSRLRRATFPQGKVFGEGAHLNAFPWGKVLREYPSLCKHKTCGGLHKMCKEAKVVKNAQKVWSATGCGGSHRTCSHTFYITHYVIDIRRLHNLIWYTSSLKSTQPSHEGWVLFWVSYKLVAAILRRAKIY